MYKGEWKLDVRFGTGMCVFGSGDIYEGEWAADKKDGKGTQIYANKDKYQVCIQSASIAALERLWSG